MSCEIGEGDVANKNTTDAGDSFLYVADAAFRLFAAGRCVCRALHAAHLCRQRLPTRLPAFHECRRLRLLCPFPQFASLRRCRSRDSTLPSPPRRTFRRVEARSGNCRSFAGPNCPTFRSSNVTKRKRSVVTPAAVKNAAANLRDCAITVCRVAAVSLLYTTRVCRRR